MLRMMAEELRHGYQMLHLLVEDDWSAATGQGQARDGRGDPRRCAPARTCSGAFNIDFDSFVDNIVFCALIDRVGKYQLAHAEGLGLFADGRVDAADAARGGLPPRRRRRAAAALGGEGGARARPMITMEVIQKHLNKWVPRGLEMFGDERGGGTNVKWGLKPMKNDEAQDQYYEELHKLVRDLNLRYLRARLPELSPAEAEALLVRLETATRQRTGRGVRRSCCSCLTRDFFRRRGVPAFRMVGVDGQAFVSRDEFVAHLRRSLPESYLAGRDFQEFLSLLDQVSAGSLAREKAAAHMPRCAGWGASAPARGRCAGSPTSRSRRDCRDGALTAAPTGAAGGPYHEPVARADRPHPSLVPKSIVGRVASRYVAGDTLEDALATIADLNREGAMATMDLLGEEVTETAARPRPASSSTSACSTAIEARKASTPTSRSSRPRSA